MNYGETRNIGAKLTVAEKFAVRPHSTAAAALLHETSGGAALMTMVSWQLALLSEASVAVNAQMQKKTEKKKTVQRKTHKRIMES